jgi:hypothetical protein
VLSRVVWKRREVDERNVQRFDSLALVLEAPLPKHFDERTDRIPLCIVLERVQPHAMWTLDQRV